MSRLLSASIVATLTCASASAYFWRALDAEREQSAVLQARVSELELIVASRPHRTEAPAPLPTPTELRDELPPQATSKTVAAVVMPRASLSAPPIRAGMQGQTDPDVRRAMRSGLEERQRMLQDPEYRELMRTQQKLAMRRMYGDLEPMLGLAKEQADRLLDVLADQQLRAMEQRLTLVADGTPPDPNAIRLQQQQFEDMRRNLEAEIAQVLGPGGYEQWRAYEQSGPARFQVAQLREFLSTTSEPLRPDQYKPLVEAIAREQQQSMSSMRGSAVGFRAIPDAQPQTHMTEDWLERLSESQRRIRDVASSVLSPSQLARLEEIQQHERTTYELNMRMQRARTDAQPIGEAGAMGLVQQFIAP